MGLLLTPFTVELADVANEIQGNVVIEYHTMKTTLTQELLNEMRTNGLLTTSEVCIMYSLVSAGKSDAEIDAFFREAEEANCGIKFSFEAQDGSKLKITSKKNNPLLDVFVRAAEGEQE